MASILEQIRNYIPATYNALADASFYGMAGLQRAVESTKARLFGTVVSESLEATIYSSFSLDYASKVAVLRIIPAAVDFWSDRPTGVQTREESLSYPSRIDSLWKLHERILIEVKQDWSAFQKMHPQVLVRSKSDTPTVSHKDDDFLTADPGDFGKSSTKIEFGRKWQSTDLPWSNWG